MEVLSKCTISTRSGLLQSSRFLLIQNSALKNGNNATGATIFSPTNDEHNKLKDEILKCKELCLTILLLGEMSLLRNPSH